MPKFNVTTFIASLAAVIVAGYILQMGKDLPVLEDAHKGFGG